MFNILHVISTHPVVFVLFHFCLIMPARVSSVQWRTDEQYFWKVGQLEIRRAAGKSVVLLQCYFICTVLVFGLKLSVHFTCALNFCFQNFNTGASEFSYHWTTAIDTLELTCLYILLSTCLYFIWFLYKYSVGIVKSIISTFISQNVKS